MQRRQFLKFASLSTLSYYASSSFSFAAQPLSPEQLYAKYVPINKGLAADWLQSLTTREHDLDAAITSTKCSGQLDVIGMTVGGVACGTVYFSGDGRLWIWDIFNQHHEGVVANNKARNPEGLNNISGRQPRERDGANFLIPPSADTHTNGVTQSFLLKTTGQKTRGMNAEDWKNVQFQGRWPVGTVRYRDSNSPVQVDLSAYSPFIPLRLEDSSLPLTILEYTLNNTSKQTQSVQFAGRLNNPLGQFSGNEHLRSTQLIEKSTWKGLLHLLSTDEALNSDEIKKTLDYGTMGLALINDELETTIDTSGKIQTSLELKPGESRTLRFAIAWHLPNLNPSHHCGSRQRHYASRFANAASVLDYYSQHQAHLSDTTKKWVQTWNDSTLPQWLLDRSILTANTLQSQNCLIFEDGRFWAWEGVGCCPGTCGHVWQYSQGHARLFPALERNLREVTDFTIGMKEAGDIRFRGSNGNSSSIDAQCAYVLRVLRDHQLSDEHGYLRRVWEPTKRALNYLIEFDESDSRGGLDGLLDGRQHNTLDAEWHGKVHVLCSMYLAALRAGEELAKRMDDSAYAKRCADIFALGSHKINSLFNGEFYEQIEDPKHTGAIGVGKGCYIDQVMGQFWSNQVGLGRLYKPEHQKTALRSLWKYNFVPEYGAFRQEFKKGRHYAGQGDSGLLMCTWPKGGLRPNFKKHWQYAYFNEFMTGFEYQAAAHMIAERDPDLVRNGLAITRAIHDRYSDKLGRNPYNEIECSDHYARAGSSYAVFLALCGFHFDQAIGLLRFDPVLTAGKFKVPFITSEGWGTYEQQDGHAKISLHYGTLRLDQIELGQRTPSTLQLNNKAINLPALNMQAGDILTMT